jgi:hypothetical protein
MGHASLQYAKRDRRVTYMVMAGRTKNLQAKDPPRLHCYRISKATEFLHVEDEAEEEEEEQRCLRTTDLAPVLLFIVYWLRTQ